MSAHRGIVLQRAYIASSRRSASCHSIAVSEPARARTSVLMPWLMCVAQDPKAIILSVQETGQALQAEAK